MDLHEFVVEELKTRVDKFLVKQLPQISRARIQKDIEGGCAEVNGQIITESKFVVRKGDKVVYKQSADSNQQTALRPTNIPLKILYNNHGLLIIDKPAGLVVHPGAGFKGQTLASALLYRFKDIHLVGEEHRPGIVHRLDKDTSGVMLIATTQEMYLYLKDAFLERKVKKEYIALVWGKMEKPHGFIDTPIGRSKTDFRKYATKNMVDPVRSQSRRVGTADAQAHQTSNGVEPKEALTEYWALEYLPVVSPFMGSKGTADKSANYKTRHIDTYTLIRVKLHTGRTHQIRVHFSSIGHPLIGDELYGNKKNRIEGLSRQFLHAKKIEVQLPEGTWIEAESELVDDLKEMLERLGSKVVLKL